MTSSAAPAQNALLYITWATDGRVHSGGGEAIEGHNPLEVVVYRRGSVAPTSIDAHIPLGVELEETITLAAAWGDGIFSAYEVTLDHSGIFTTRDLGDGPIVEDLMKNLGMIYWEHSARDARDNAAPFTRLSVHGFRGFGEEATLELAQPTGKAGSGLTIVVGANNSGKSTFLEALQMIARARGTSDISISQPRRHSRRDQVDLQLDRSDGRRLSVRSIRRGSSQAKAVWHPKNGEPESFPIQVTPSRRSFSPFHGSMGGRSRDWSLMDGELSRTSTRDSFIGRLQHIDRDPESRSVFDPLLKRIVGYPVEWTFDEVASGQQFVKLTESDGSWHTSEGLGEGLISLLFIVDALYDSDPGSLIAIDEPELSLHPQLVRRLREVLSEYAADRQILIATHSPLLIDWSDVLAGAKIARTFKSEGQAVLAQASADSLQAIAQLALSGNRFNPHLLGETSSEAFFLDDGVLLVEGQDDVVFLRTITDDLQLPHFNSTFGWGVGGATNMPLVATLLLELGFSRIAALLDGDDHEGTNSSAEQLASLGDRVAVGRLPAGDIRHKRARRATPEKTGVLDTANKHVRPELADETRRTLTALQDHLADPRFE